MTLGFQKVSPIQKIFRITKKEKFQMQMEDVSTHYPNISRTQITAALVLNNYNVEDAKLMLELRIQLECKRKEMSCETDEPIPLPLNLSMKSPSVEHKQKPELSTSKVNVLSNIIVNLPPNNLFTGPTTEIVQDKTYLNNTKVSTSISTIPEKENPLCIQSYNKKLKTNDLPKENSPAKIPVAVDLENTKNGHHVFGNHALSEVKIETNKYAYTRETEINNCIKPSHKIAKTDVHTKNNSLLSISTHKNLSNLEVNAESGKQSCTITNGDAKENTFSDINDLVPKENGQKLCNDYSIYKSKTTKQDTETYTSKAQSLSSAVNKNIPYEYYVKNKLRTYRKSSVPCITNRVEISNTLTKSVTTNNCNPQDTKDVLKSSFEERNILDNMGVSYPPNTKFKNIAANKTLVTLTSPAVQNNANKVQKSTNGNVNVFNIDTTNKNKTLITPEKISKTSRFEKPKTDEKTKVSHGTAKKITENSDSVFLNKNLDINTSLKKQNDQINKIPTDNYGIVRYNNKFSINNNTTDSNLKSYLNDSDLFKHSEKLWDGKGKPNVSKTLPSVLTSEACFHSLTPMVDGNPTSLLQDQVQKQNLPNNSWPLLVRPLVTTVTKVSENSSQIPASSNQPAITSYLPKTTVLNPQVPKGKSVHLGLPAQIPTDPRVTCKFPQQKQTKYSSFCTNTCSTNSNIPTNITQLSNQPTTHNKTNVLSEKLQNLSNEKHIIEAQNYADNESKKISIQPKILTVNRFNSVPDTFKDDNKIPLQKNQKVIPEIKNILPTTFKDPKWPNNVGYENVINIMVDKFEDPKPQYTTIGQKGVISSNAQSTVTSNCTNLPTYGKLSIDEKVNCVLLPTTVALNMQISRQATAATNLPNSSTNISFATDPTTPVVYHKAINTQMLGKSTGANKTDLINFYPTDVTGFSVAPENNMQISHQSAVTSNDMNILTHGKWPTNEKIKNFTLPPKTVNVSNMQISRQATAPTYVPNLSTNVSFATDLANSSKTNNIQIFRKSTEADRNNYINFYPTDVALNDSTTIAKTFSTGGNTTKLPPYIAAANTSNWPTKVHFSTEPTQLNNRVACDKTVLSSDKMQMLRQSPKSANNSRLLTKNNIPTTSVPLNTSTELPQSIYPSNIIPRLHQTTETAYDLSLPKNASTQTYSTFQNTFVPKSFEVPVCMPNNSQTNYTTISSASTKDPRSLLKANIVYMPTNNVIDSRSLLLSTEKDKENGPELVNSNKDKETKSSGRNGNSLLGNGASSPTARLVPFSSIQELKLLPKNNDSTSEDAAAEPFNGRLPNVLRHPRPYVSKGMDSFLPNLVQLGCNTHQNSKEKQDSNEKALVPKWFDQDLTLLHNTSVKDSILNTESTYSIFNFGSSITSPETQNNFRQTLKEKFSNMQLHFDNGLATFSKDGDIKNWSQTILKLYSQGLAVYVAKIIYDTENNNQTSQKLLEVQNNSQAHETLPVSKRTKSKKANLQSTSDLGNQEGNSSILKNSSTGNLGSDSCRVSNFSEPEDKEASSVKTGRLRNLHKRKRVRSLDSSIADDDNSLQSKHLKMVICKENNTYVVKN